MRVLLFFFVKLDVTVFAMTHRILIVSMMFVANVWPIGFVNRQSSGNRADHKIFHRNIVIYRNLPLFVDPQNCEGKYAKILWIHKIVKVSMPKFCGSTKF